RRVASTGRTNSPAVRRARILSAFACGDQPATVPPSAYPPMRPRAPVSPECAARFGVGIDGIRGRLMLTPGILLIVFSSFDRKLLKKPTALLIGPAIADTTFSQMPAMLSLIVRNLSRSES